MNLNRVFFVIGGSIILGILGGIVTRSLLVGIGLPIVLVIFFVMMYAVKPPTSDGGDDKDKTSQ